MSRLTNLFKHSLNFSFFLNQTKINFKNQQNVRNVFYLTNFNSLHLNQIKSYDESGLKKSSYFPIDAKCYSTKKSKEKGNKIQKPKVELRNEEINEVINYEQLISGFKEANEKLKADLNDNFNLRLTPSSFEQIIVKTAEGNMRLGEIAQVEVKSPTLFQINMIDTPDYVKNVFEAILKSNLNTNPQLDKTTINLPIAKVTREGRESMAKNIKLKCEQALKKMRDIEGKALRKAKENKKVSSDLAFNVGQHIKYQFELFQKQATDLRDAKIKEVLQE